MWCSYMHRRRNGSESGGHVFEKILWTCPPLLCGTRHFMRLTYNLYAAPILEQNSNSIYIVSFFVYIIYNNISLSFFSLNIGLLAQVYIALHNSMFSANACFYFAYSFNSESNYQFYFMYTIVLLIKTRYRYLQFQLSTLCSQKLPKNAALCSINLRGDTRFLSDFHETETRPRR